MIEYAKGDLLDSKANIIVHCANCLHTMGGGIAAQIARKYPEALDADKKTAYGDKEKLGHLSIAATKDNKYIINLYGQFSIGAGRQLDYEAFYKGITMVRDKMDALYANPASMKKLKLKKIVVGFPYAIGCALAGGSWTIVHTMLRDVFTETPYEVIIVEWDK